MPAINNVISNQFIGDNFERIIDGCVYELFFREHMKKLSINIISSVQEMIVPISHLSNMEKAETIVRVFNNIKKTDNEIRNRLNLFSSRSPILKNIIES
jgi:hypothetical protein